MQISTFLGCTKIFLDFYRIFKAAKLIMAFLYYVKHKNMLWMLLKISQNRAFLKFSSKNYLFCRIFEHEYKKILCEKCLTSGQRRRFFRVCSPRRAGQTVEWAGTANFRRRWNISFSRHIRKRRINRWRCQILLQQRRTCCRQDNVIASWCGQGRRREIGIFTFSAFNLCWQKLFDYL